MVGYVHGIFVVLHDYQRIAYVRQMAQSCQQLFVVFLMEAYAWFVQYIEHAHQAGAYLRRQPYALGLPSGKRSGRSAQRQIVETHVDEEAESCLYFFQNLIGDLSVLFRKVQPLDEIKGFPYGHIGKLGYIFSAYCYC